MRESYLCRASKNICLFWSMELLKLWPRQSGRLKGIIGVVFLSIMKKKKIWGFWKLSLSLFCGNKNHQSVAGFIVFGGIDCCCYLLLSIKKKKEGKEKARGCNKWLLWTKDRETPINSTSVSFSISKKIDIGYFIMFIFDFSLFCEKKSNLAHRPGPGQMYKCLKNVIPLWNFRNVR